MKYSGHTQFKHNTQPSTGILLINLGTPDAATPSAVRKYLAEFLADPRVVEMPRIIWRLILHGIILRIRPRPVARNYAKIWTEQGSPLLVKSQAIADKLQSEIAQELPGPVHVALAMRYGQPSIAAGLQQLREKNIERLLILPMYPQYSATTTAAIFDEVSHQLQRWRWIPQFRMLMQYHDHPLYIQAIVDQIQHSLEANGKPDKLILSFHGIPQRYHQAGDPYFCQCQKTARLISEKLNLASEEWMLCFQSRFGREPWLQPYLDKTLEAMPEQGIKSVQIIAPGFAADCLETLEELAMQNHNLFIKRGGEFYHYIPALNESDSHIDLLLALIKQETKSWPETDADTQPIDITSRSVNAEALDGY
ncbi:MAG: ferrochelatase [Thioalkalispiraceae bacterium]|jgi:ferrochelatase